MVWARKGVRRLGAIVFQLGRTGSYAQKGLGVYVGVSHPTLTTQRLRRGVILQRKIEALLLIEGSNSGQAKTEIYYKVGCYKGITKLRCCKACLRIWENKGPG